MRIVSWNMGNNSVRSNLHDAAWHHLLDPAGLAADVALVQEAVPPPWLDHSHSTHWLKAWPNRAWGTGIVVRAPAKLTPVVAREVEGGRFVVARLTIEAGDFVVVSVHSITNEAVVADFIPPLAATFDAIREECRGARFIVGGDLNTARMAEEYWPGRGHAEFWRDLDATGFRSSYWAEHGYEPITLDMRPGGRFASQADHIFIDADTSADMTIHSSIDDDTHLSDHRALVVDMEQR